MSAWRGLVAWLAAWQRAVDVTYDDIQDRRILALEREVADLKQLYLLPGGGQA